MNQLRKHYLESKQIELPPNPERHQYKIMLQDKTFIRIKKKIPTVQKLREHLLILEKQGKFRIEDIKAIYWGTLEWLNPEKVTTLQVSQGYQTADRLILRDVLPFDIDGDGTDEGLDWARKESIKLLDWIDKQGLTILHIAFSGRKGFHIPTYGPSLPSNAKDRLATIQKNRKLYYTDLLKKDITVCEASFPDPTRILKIIGSADPQTGLTCTKLKRSDLLLPIPQLKAKINQIKLPPLKQPPKPEKKELTPRNQHFITSKILGTKNLHIIILKYNNTTQRSKINQITNKLSKTYQMSNWHILKNARHYYILNPTAVTTKRLQKILNTAKPLNQHKKIHYYPINNERNQQGKITETEPYHITTINHPKPKPHTTSKAHTTMLLTKYSIQTPGNKCGNNQAQITKTTTQR